MIRWLLGLSGSIAAAVALAASPIVAVPEAVNRSPALEKAQPRVEFLAPPTGRIRAIDLGEPVAAERKATGTTRSRTMASGKGTPLQIGFSRDVGAADSRVNAAGLDWVPVADGGRAARITLASAGAKALRLRLELPGNPAGIVVRVAGSGKDEVHGPYNADEMAIATGFWTPVLEGGQAIVELHAQAGVSVDSVILAIPQVSHITLSATELRTAKRVTDIGDSDSCELDIACVANPSQALLNAAKAVAKMIFTENGRTFLCTGTLLNDSAQSFTPLLYTAHHCILDQAAATTVNTYWFFDAVSCNNLAVPPYVLLTGGAKLLAGSNDYDWALLRLNSTPPAAAAFAAWRAETIPTGAIVTTLHHPSGDLKKFSQGNTTGYASVLTSHDDGSRSGGGTFIDVLWSQGSTEGGSSGAGLFTFLSSGGFYELRGGLFGGLASCTARSEKDHFSRLDVALPVLREYLTPTAGYPGGITPVVEFYNAGLNHFFITADPNEIRELDAGTRIRGWVRTGFRFLAYNNPTFAPSGVTPVCRFYLRPGVGDSHFYSASPQECADVQRRFGASWIYESASVFWTLLPNQVTGACPAGTTAVYRFFDDRTLNHRFTTEKSIRDDLIDFGRTQEGYGSPPDQVAMCAPNG